jgi:putative ABC transport system permease protein
MAVTLLNLKTVPQRFGSSIVCLVGIAGVVVVLVAVLSIAEGFDAVLREAGSPSRIVVMRSGSTSEMTSGLEGPLVDVIKQAPGLELGDQMPVASAELYVIIDLPKKSTGTSANVPLRGVEPTVFKVRDQASIVEGRMFQFGTSEVIVGRAAAAQFSGLTVGSEIRSGQMSWTVVGMFESDASVSETEIWGDARTLQGAYRRGNSFQSVLARLDSAASFETAKDWLTSNPQLRVDVQRERDYYAAQSLVLTRLIRTIGFGIAALMAVGAIFGAILTMYTAVATRTREIATLRALGFDAFAVLVSVLAESLALSAVGGIAGGVVAYLAFHGYQTSTVNFQTFSQVAFAFQVTPGLLATGLVWALLMGLIGGLLPAIRAARLPISQALREL